MRNVLIKEMKLGASPLSYIFILFGLMFFLPGYPVLCGAFFVTLGIFKSFELTRETNDILFSTLLPISKRDVVKGKYLFVCFIECCGLLLMAIVVIIRMTCLSESIIYTGNALMNANLFALSLAFLIFGLFNLIFLCGFFKTAYKIISFLPYIFICFIVIGAGEALCHFPGLAFLNAFGTDYFTIQVLLLAAGIILYVLLTLISYNRSCKRFEMLDL